MIRKNKKFIDPRYFMDEKTELDRSSTPSLGAPGLTATARAGTRTR